MNEVKYNIEEEISRLLEVLSKMDPASKEYADVIKNVNVLSGIVLDDDRNTISLQKQEFDERHKTAEREFAEAQKKLEFAEQKKHTAFDEEHATTEFEARQRHASFEEAQRILEFEAQQKNTEADRSERHSKESHDRASGEINRWADRAVTVLVEGGKIGLAAAQLIFMGYMFREGMHFEKTGNLTSKIFTEIRGKAFKFK